MIARTGTRNTLNALARNDRGNVAMLFALSCLVIFPMIGFTIDFSRIMVDKQKLQMATDAAALAAAHDAHMTAEERSVMIEAHLNHLEEELGRQITYTISQDSDGQIALVTHLTVDTTISKIMGRQNVDVTVRSNAIEGGADIEVALILDITGSMSGSRITALKQAAQDLVDIVIEEEQAPYYSKASVVPYSLAVNVGAYAPTVRGAITPGRGITAAVWQTGASKNISGATRANPVVITSNGHGFADGDRVWISGVNGMTQLNNKVYTVANANANTFRLSGVNGSSYSNYNNGGIIRKCLNTNCQVTVTANAHGNANNDHIVISGVSGMTQINTASNATWQVSGVTANTFVLVNSVGPNYGAYTNGGTSFCTLAGCEWYRFTNTSNAQRLHRISTCATERTGAEAYTDASSAGNPVGRAYLSTSNACPTNTIVPLTADTDVLEDAIQDLQIGGSTAGHMGVAWGLYTLSPTFGSIFPDASKPAAYGRPKLHKFAVFMTDGDFNSSFCKGVLSKSSYNMGDRINCESENGTSFAQAAQYCTAMKNQGITVYTVGFEVGNSNAARTALTNCASSTQDAYFPSGSQQLRDAFEQIALSITEVRLVH